MLVLDCSVILKWLIPEDDSNFARRYFDLHKTGETTIFLPYLFYYEILNVLATKTKLKETEINSALSILSGLRLQTVLLEPGDDEDLISLSRKHNISGYDAVYLQLASKLKCSFITADKKLVKRVADLKYVRLLGED